MSDIHPVIRARGLMKRYGTVIAMDGADFELYPGEICAVIGDNGAGKSTLIKGALGCCHARPRRGSGGRRSGPFQITG